MSSNEPRRYRFIACPECSHQFEHLGDRIPNYCIECGKPIFVVMAGHSGPRPGIVLIDDKNARLSYGTTS